MQAGGGHSTCADADARHVLQVQKELEEERQAEEQQRHAQEAIQAKVAELKAIEAARRQEVREVLRCSSSMTCLGVCVGGRKEAYHPPQIKKLHSDIPQEIPVQEVWLVYA